MKKFTSIMLFMSIMFTLFAGVGQAAEISKVPRLFLEGVELKALTDPKIVDDRTLVPVRVLAEGLGYGISWDGVTETVTVENDTGTIKLMIGTNIALVKDHFVEMDTKAILENGTTLVPIRFIGEQFGLSFEWVAESMEVHMTKQLEETPETTEPGTTEPGTTEPGAEGTDPKEPGEEEQNSEQTSIISNIGYNGMDQILIFHTGELSIDRTLTLGDPLRAVFDFKDASFSEEIIGSFAGGEIKSMIEDHAFLNGFRYSLFQKSPSIARLVLDVKEDIAYKLDTEEGLTTITLMTAKDAVNEEGMKLPGEDKPPVVVDPNADKVYHIVIDAGHGGSDPGAPSVQGTREKVFNLNVALKVKALLEKEEQLQAHLTRSDDTFIALNDRVKFAEDLKADLFVSIHANSIDRANITGTETYYSRESSKGFANVMHKHMLEATGLPNRYVKQADFRVIKSTTMPAILLEAGYLSNATDAKAILSDATQNKIAAAIVAGIKEYLKLG